MVPQLCSTARVQRSAWLDESEDEDAVSSKLPNRPYYVAPAPLEASSC